MRKRKFDVVTYRCKGMLYGAETEGSEWENGSLCFVADG